MAVTKTFSADGTGESVRLQYGKGYILFDATSGNGFGSGTLTLQVQKKDGSSGWVTVTTYAAAPDPNPDGLDFGADVMVRGVLSGSTSPTLYMEIGEGRTP
jgi:hypothetical protein